MIPCHHISHVLTTTCPQYTTLIDRHVITIMQASSIHRPSLLHSIDHPPHIAHLYRPPDLYSPKFSSVLHPPSQICKTTSSSLWPCFFSVPWYSWALRWPLTSTNVHISPMYTLTRQVQWSPLTGQDNKYLWLHSWAGNLGFFPYNRPLFYDLNGRTTAITHQDCFDIWSNT